MICYCAAIPLYVFGPETHMTAICGMALKKKPIPTESAVAMATANFLLPAGQQQREAQKTQDGMWINYIDF